MLSNAIVDNALPVFPPISVFNLFNLRIWFSILEGAFAYNALFENVIIDGADFTDVLISNDVKNKLCVIADGVNSVTNKKTSETLDC